jgi:hypothetical protein
LGLKLLQAARPTCGLLRFTLTSVTFQSRSALMPTFVEPPRMIRQRWECSLATWPKCRFPTRLLHFFAGLSDAISLRLTEL